MYFKKWLAVVLSVAFIMGVLAISPSVSAAEPKVLKYGYLSPPFVSMGKTSEFFKKYVEEHTGGSLKIELYPLGQLGGMMAMFESILSGTLDMGTVSAPIMANAMPEFNALCLPFVVRDVDVMWKILWTKEFKDKMDNIVRKKGIHPLFICDNGTRGFLNKKRVVRSPEDIKGMSVRVMQGPMYTDMFTAMGAKTRTLSFPELYTALQQGLVDGEDNSLDMAVAQKFVEVEKFFTPLAQTMIVVYSLGSDKMWKSLTDKERQVILEAREATEKASKGFTADDAAKAIPKAIEKYGVKIDPPLTAQEREVFRKAMVPVVKKYEKIIGPDVFNLYTDLAKKYEQ